MKKLLTGIVAMAFVFSAGSTTVFAHGHSHSRRYAECNTNELCDYCNSLCHFIDNDGDDICDICGSEDCRKCTGFVDANGDGICDNYKSCVCGDDAKYSGANCGNHTAASQNCSGSKQGHCGGHARHGRHCR